MRLVFAGTPEAAVPSLEALLTSSRHDVVAVVSRPDARTGRGRSLSRSPVAAAADAAGIEVLTPPNARDPEFAERLRELAPDAVPVVAYGHLVPRPVLDIPAHGWVNLHFSLLPAWRGAAPVNAAIEAGDEVTGATTFRLDEGMDTGPVLGTMTETIRPRDTAGDLLGRLSQSGAGLLVATLDALETGELRAAPQPTDGISHAGKITV
ncbi:MAG: methionyl-tRNA formyltransferase, partial [Dietzia sp.]